MGKLSKYEKETIVNFNEGETEATVYTHNVDLKRSLAEFGGKYPTHCRLKCENEAGGVTYVLEKSRLSIRLVPPYSEECRAAAWEYAKRHGLYSWNRKQHNFSVFYGQNDGCRPVVLTVFCLQNRKIWDIFYYERIQGGLYGGQEIFWIYACQQPGTE